MLTHLSGRQTFVPLSLKNGSCPGDHLHFRGAAREIYKYLRLLSTRHGGFVFPSIKNIAAHTKNWKKQPSPYSYKQCWRILKLFQKLGILSEYRAVVIRGRTYHGWQFADHHWWAETQGDICEFKYWVEYEEANSSSCRSSGPYTQQNGHEHVHAHVKDHVHQDYENVREHGQRG